MQWPSRSPFLDPAVMELCAETLLSQAAARRDLFRPGAVAKLVTVHVTGGEDHTSRLWLLLMLELWLREFTG